MRLTGKTRHRHSWPNKLILQVEEVRTHHDHYTFESSDYITWRDARVEDLAELERKKNESS